MYISRITKAILKNCQENRKMTPLTAKNGIFKKIQKSSISPVIKDRPNIVGLGWKNCTEIISHPRNIKYKFWFTRKRESNRKLCVCVFNVVGPDYWSVRVTGNTHYFSKPILCLNMWLIWFLLQWWFQTWEFTSSVFENGLALNSRVTLHGLKNIEEGNSQSFETEDILGSTMNSLNVILINWVSIIWRDFSTHTTVTWAYMKSCDTYSSLLF